MRAASAWCGSLGTVQWAATFGCFKGCARQSSISLAGLKLQTWRLVMCRNIRTLYNFEPPATDDEIRASALQFVRKLSGFTRPSKTNEAAFNRAVDAVTEAAHELLASLVTTAPPRDRAHEAAKARARSAARFG
jgi:hypothetical protein